MRSSAIAAVAASLGSLVYAQTANTCPESDICYQLNIPEATASSGTGDIFLQISAATSYEWVALGQGTRMAGSNIFVMYTSADGNNVTVSPRLGTGHVEPEHDTAAQITVLDGSGVENGRMTANIRCGNCGSWNGGSMDFTASSASWIHAYKTGSALNSDDLSASISQHDDADSFTWDLAQAKGGNSVNPFVSAAVTTGTSAAPSASGSSSQSAPTSSGNSGSSGNAGGSSSSASPTSRGTSYNTLSLSKQNTILLAHAVLACLAFVALFPIGGILIRVASFPNLIWVHAALQILAYLLFTAAVGLGLYMAIGTYLDQPGLPQAHTIIGLVLFGLFFFQPAGGWMHHRMFNKFGGRTVWSYAHVYIGRFGIILGMINGGLGLWLASADRGAIIAYSVITGLVGATYLATMVFGEVKRSRFAGQVQGGREKRDRSSGSSGQLAV